MKVTPGNAAWFLPLFDSGSRRMPSPRTFEPYYNATSWDFDDLMRAFREDAVMSGPAVWEACAVFLSNGRWPRMKVEPAFWLRERWSMAGRLCRAIFDETSQRQGGCLPAKPDDQVGMLEHLVIDIWDDSFVDLWLRHNARSYARVDPGADTDAHVEFEIAMRAFEARR